ncbi:putative cell wall protein [Aspergillus foveolatus]|uniref:putative cell wall protein n=1 Tax=Aspergillus foveolatus TaxID=210207 RepID=UPI003CCC9190
MRTSIALLAGLAGSALALPATPSTQLDTRTFGLISGIIHTIENILTGGVTPANVLSGISSEAAAALQGGALGCTAGSVDLAYRKKLAHWLKAGDGVHLEASVRKALLAWCEADASVDLELDLEIRAGLGFFIPTCAKIAAEADLYVNLDGVFELATDALAVLSATAQAALEAAIALLGEVDWRIKAGLEFCAAGGVVGDLDSEIIHALKVWLNSSECTLAVSLKKTLLLWIEGKVSGDVVSIGNLPVGGVATIGVGKSLEALVGVNGALVAGAQAQLEAFLQTDVGLEIDVAILDILKICAKGGLAVDIDLDKRVELSLWLASSKCSLSAELKGLLAFWLSFGVSAETDLSLSVSTNIISELTGFLTGTIDSLLGTHLHGLLSFILGGEGVLSLSLEARAQLAALIGGGVGIEIDDSIQIILIGWLTGCQKCCGGSQVTHGPSVPSSTPALPASETPSVPVVPTGAQPTETPSVPAGTPAVPTDVSPTDTETPASPSETPCDTITSESVTSYTVSESASVPAGTETPAVPTDVQPTETPAAPSEAQPSETPCETLTSDSVTSYTVSQTTSVPAVPTEVSPSSSSCAGCGGIKTVTVTKTVGIEACPTDF